MSGDDQSFDGTCPTCGQRYLQDRLDLATKILNHPTVQFRLDGVDDDELGLALDSFRALSKSPGHL